MDFEKLARKQRRKPILDLDAATMTRVSYGVELVHRLIPHRDPFCFVDRVDGIDFEQQGIVGGMKIELENPIFKGHFPGYAIWPGVLQIEMIGQLGICYYDFLTRQSTEMRDDFSELGVRALKIHHTLFQHEVLPGDDVTILAKLLDKDDYTFTGMGQVMNNGKVCTIAIAEFYIV